MLAGHAEYGAFLAWLNLRASPPLVDSLKFRSALRYGQRVDRHGLRIVMQLELETLGEPGLKHQPHFGIRRCRSGGFSDDLVALTGIDPSPGRTPYSPTP